MHLLLSQHKIIQASHSSVNIAKHPEDYVLNILSNVMHASINMIIIASGLEIA
jgi:hypothetical protein